MAIVPCSHCTLQVFFFIFRCGHFELKPLFNLSGVDISHAVLYTKRGFYGWFLVLLIEYSSYLQRIGVGLIYLSICLLTLTILTLWLWSGSIRSQLFPCHNWHLKLRDGHCLCIFRKWNIPSMWHPPSRSVQISIIHVGWVFTRRKMKIRCRHSKSLHGMLSHTI